MFGLVALVCDVVQSTLIAHNDIYHECSYKKSLFLAASMKEYMSSLCMFTKLLTVFLLGRYNVLYAAVYVVLCVCKYPLCFLVFSLTQFFASCHVLSMLYF